MRLPTKAEWEAFQSEQVDIHKNCHKTGKCVHHEPARKLAKLMVGDAVFKATAAMLYAHPSVGAEDLLFMYTIAFREGMALGEKLAENDRLEKLCSGKS